MVQQVIPAPLSLADDPQLFCLFKWQPFGPQELDQGVAPFRGVSSP